MKLKVQFKMLFNRKEFFISFLVMLIFAVASVLINCYTYYGADMSKTVSANQLMLISNTNKTTSYFYILLPLLVGLPFAETHYIEEKNNILPIIISRAGNRKKYFFSKLIVVFLSSFIIFLIPLLINMLLSMLAFPLSSIKDFSNFSAGEMFLYDKGYGGTVLFHDLFVTNPYLYNFVFCVMLSVFSGLAGVFVYTVSFFIKKNRILLIASFFILVNAMQIISVITVNFGINLRILDYLFALNDGMFARSKYLTFFILTSIFIITICILTSKDLKKMDDILCNE